MANWSKETLYARIVARWDELTGVYTKVNRNRDYMATYFRSDEVVDTDDNGDLVGQSIYNGSGSWYSRKMATMFQGSLVSKNIAWIRYKMDQHELKGIDELDIWLQKIKDYMSDCYQKSNFYDVQPQFTHDGVTLGSPVMFAEEDKKTKRTMWMPQHYKNVRVYYDKYNQPEGVIVEDKTWTAKKIFDTFIGEDDDNYTKSTSKLAVSIVNALREGRLNEKFKVYRATFKTTDPMWVGDNKDGKGFKKPNGTWDWLTAYFTELTVVDKDKEDKPLNANMGDFTQPFSVWNFDKKFWEASSRTPAWYAIWDNMSLQQMDKNLLEDVQNVNRRAFIALKGQRNNVDLSPEGEMYVTEAEYDRPPKFLDRVTGIQFSQEAMEIKVESLKRWFYADQFSMFTDLANNKNQPVTATQIWQMAGEKATLLSPAIETHSRYLESVDARMIDIEYRAGRGPFDPETMGNITDIIRSNVTREIKEVDIQPVFIGQLAQAQKTTQALNPIQNTIEAVAPLFQVEPNLRFKYRWYELAGKVEDALDFPQDVVVPKDEYDKRVAAANKAAADQQELENTIEIAKASKDVSKNVEPDSILATVGEAEAVGG